jgi:PAS domain S-box-containing protein
MVGIAHITRDLSLESSAEEKFRLAVEACPTGMVMTDSAGRIVLANTETERLFGYRRDELIGQSIEMLLPQRLRNAHRQHRAGFSRRPEIRRLGKSRNLLGCHRDGSEFPIEIGLYPIRNGEDPLVLSVIVDIGERKRMERLKDEFVSTVSHELRTPLTSIAGSLGLLIGGAAGTLPEPAARLIRIAQSNSQRLVRLINDILDIEKIESGQTVFKFKRLSARALVEQVIEANRGYADGFQVRVRLDADATAGEVYADPDRLAQVITNLLSNAIKFSPPGDEVVVAINERDDTVRIAIRDHGHGIPNELLCEDDLDTALAVRDGLRPVGFSTDFAHSPADTMTRAQTTHYDAVLVDLDLPDGNGVGLVRALRELPEICETPVVVISDAADWDKGGGVDSSHLNVLECIHKPVNVDRVAQVLDRVIARDASGRAQILHVDDDREAV